MLELYLPLKKILPVLFAIGVLNLDDIYGTAPINLVTKNFCNVYLQVLDEIHRQPVSLSLSMVSLPAPESVVDSFPLKSHKKVNTSESSDVEQYVS